MSRLSVSLSLIVSVCMHVFCAQMFHWKLSVCHPDVGEKLFLDQVFASDSDVDSQRFYCLVI